jgi:hypothetical protein
MPLVTVSEQKLVHTSIRACMAPAHAISANHFVAIPIPFLPSLLTYTHKIAIQSNTKKTPFITLSQRPELPWSHQSSPPLYRSWFRPQHSGCLLLVLPGLSLQGVQGPTGKERREKDEKGEEKMERDGRKMDRIGRDETGPEEKGWDQW